MRMKIALVAPWIAATAIGGAISLAPIAAADTDPLVPNGGDAFDAPSQGPNPGSFGWHEQNQDEVTPQDSVDVPY
ncbi:MULTISPECIES: hypothetical protein [unclassified Mycolicibacterium]|uniref:hypothetical protein n=1 Tax=unclassified Mycolicibacterium TaxID=2636767 RepID=UPI001EE4C7A2|nr:MULTISPECIES: hypothetical protein [unclassified Mycolicibacterium]